MIEGRDGRLDTQGSGERHWEGGRLGILYTERCSRGASKLGIDPAQGPGGDSAKTWLEGLENAHQRCV